MKKVELHLEVLHLEEIRSTVSYFRAKIRKLTILLSKDEVIKDNERRYVYQTMKATAGTHALQKINHWNTRMREIIYWNLLNNRFPISHMERDILLQEIESGLKSIGATLDKVGPPPHSLKRLDNLTKIMIRLTTSTLKTLGVFNE